VVGASKHTKDPSTFIYFLHFNLNKMKQLYALVLAFLLLIPSAASADHEDSFDYDDFDQNYEEEDYGNYDDWDDEDFDWEDEDDWGDYDEDEDYDDWDDEDFDWEDDEWGDYEDDDYGDWNEDDFDWDDEDDYWGEEEDCDHEDEEDFYDDYDFEDEREDISDELEEELDYIENPELQNEIAHLMNVLEDVEDEDDYFDLLDSIFDQLDEYYESEDFDWDDDDLAWEDEDFDWEDDEWGDYDDEDYDDDDFEFDFEEEKFIINEELNEELSELEDTELASTLVGAVAALQSIQDEDEYFDALESIYETLDSHYLEIYGEDFFDDFDWDEDDFYSEETTLSTYDVNGDTITHVSDNEDVEIDLEGLQQAKDQHGAIWNTFVELIPAEYRTEIATFEVFTDGIDGTMAAVAQNEEDPTKWDLFIDVEDAADKAELAFTLIHEFAHVLSLNSEQVDPLTEAAYTDYESSESMCSTLFLDEGCSEEGSYINQFFQNYWSSIQGELDSIESIEDDNEYFDALDEFYAERANEFVSDYAATNVAEDLAETFTHFVMNDKPSDETVANSKILFFYGFDELVQLRDQIRQHL